MMPDKNQIRGLASLPDEELQRRLRAVLTALGVDGAKADAQLSDMGKIKSKLSGVTDAEIKLITAALGSQKARDAVDALNGKKSGE